MPEEYVWCDLCEGWSTYTTEPATGAFDSDGKFVGAIQFCCTNNHHTVFTTYRRIEVDS